MLGCLAADMDQGIGTPTVVLAHQELSPKGQKGLQELGSNEAHHNLLYGDDDQTFVFYKMFVVFGRLCRSSHFMFGSFVV